jgi:hypothetical protein
VIGGIAAVAAGAYGTHAVRVKSVADEQRFAAV